jgi:type IV pilus assembly protein PilE
MGMQRSRRLARIAGFSSMELMLVVAVLALLAAFQYPSYKDSIRKARRAEAKAGLLQLMQMQERYYSRHTTYVAFNAADAQGFKWHSGDSPRDSAYEFSARPCERETIQTCVMLVAEPGSRRVNASYTDDACGALTLTSVGVRSASGREPNCW